jgi:hypothetical protein
LLELICFKTDVLLIDLVLGLMFPKND